MTIVFVGVFIGVVFLVGMGISSVNTGRRP